MDPEIAKTKERAAQKCPQPLWKEITKTDLLLNLVTMGGLSLIRQQDYWRDVRAHQACVDAEFKELLAKYRW